MLNILKTRKIRSLIHILKIFLKAKKVFFKPLKRKYLVIDSRNFFLLKNYLGNKNFNVIHSRGEEINLYVVIYALLNLNFRNLQLSYINAYIKLTKPKCCITLNHAKLFFYQIKKYNQDLITIVFQNGHVFLKYPYSKFLNAIRQENLKFGKKNLSVDYAFSHNSYFSTNLFKKYVKCQTIEVGGFKNNHYFKKKKIKKKKIITFISQFRLDLWDTEFITKDFYESEKLLLPNLYRFCKKNDFSLEILGSEWDPKKEINFLKKILKNNDWTFHKRTINNYSYSLTDQSSIVVFIDSNLGWESLGRGNKTVSFSLRDGYHASYYNSGFEFLKKNGNFWTTFFSDVEFNRVMNYAKNTSLKKWRTDNALLIKQIMQYDYRNKEFKKILSNI